VRRAERDRPRNLKDDVTGDISRMRDLPEHLGSTRRVRGWKKGEPTDDVAADSEQGGDRPPRRDPPNRSIGEVGVSVGKDGADVIRTELDLTLMHHAMSVSQPPCMSRSGR